jgi:DNA-binding PadR family transcriptional regulator
VRQTDRPDKTLYRITYAGLERLRTGLEQVGSTVNRNPLELRIFYGAHRSREAVIADLERVRDQQREHLAEPERSARRPGPADGSTCTSTRCASPPRAPSSRAR